MSAYPFNSTTQYNLTQNSFSEVGGGSQVNLDSEEIIDAV